MAKTYLPTYLPTTVCYSSVSIELRNLSATIPISEGDL